MPVQRVRRDSFNGIWDTETESRGVSKRSLLEGFLFALRRESDVELRARIEERIKALQKQT